MCRQGIGAGVFMLLQGAAGGADATEPSVSRAAALQAHKAARVASAKSEFNIVDTNSAERTAFTDDCQEKPEARVVEQTLEGQSRPDPVQSPAGRPTPCYRVRSASCTT